MARPIDLSEFTTVRDRIAAFHARYPSGSIRTELVVLRDDLIVFKALVFRDREDPVPTTGWAHERVGPDPAGGPHLVEGCETTAVGRALANLNLAGGKRPSREEMARVRRRLRAARAGRGS